VANQIDFTSTTPNQSPRFRLYPLIMNKCRIVNDSHPESKLSAWCPPAVAARRSVSYDRGDLLLTRPVGEEVHILEGLSSNVFFIYTNNKLRTANDGVLKGYARKLVLDCAKACGLHYDQAPIGVQDAQIWCEVFLTHLLLSQKSSFLMRSEMKFAKFGRTTTILKSGSCCTKKC
jgi:Amino-transferase class IV